MRGVTRLLRRYWRQVAVVACLLGMFWPVAQLAFLWAGVEDPLDWLYRQYFVDRYFAAFALGLIVNRWAVVSIAPFGAVAAVVVTIGARESAGDATTLGYFAAWSVYLEAALTWLWIAGLMAVGILLSRRVGGLVTPTRMSDAPGEAPAG